MDFSELNRLIKADSSRYQLRVFEEVISTNESVKELASPGQIGIAIASRQTGGRGRLGRSFTSPDGGLYISFIYHPHGGFERNFSIMPISALCVCRMVEKISGVKCVIKWPNDVLAGDKKICGILSEGFIEESEEFIIVGIGVNVNTDLPESLPMAASLKSLTGVSYAMEKAAAELINIFMDVLERFPEDEEYLLDMYAEKCVTLNREITATSNGHRIKGRAVGIGKGGSLIVRDLEGNEIEVFSGEATLRE